MRTKLLIGIIVILSFAFVFKIVVFDNVNFLCQIAEGLDDPSTLYYFTIERIFKIAEKGAVGKSLTENISTGENRHLHYLYIRILGVTGENDTIPCLMKTYIEHQHQNSGESKSMRHIVIRSLGFIGDEKVNPFLEKILNEQHHDKMLNFVIAEALYLLTGERHDFINWQGNEEKLFVSKELMQARQVILDTKGKKRKFEDMIILDRLLRPPGR